MFGDVKAGPPSATPDLSYILSRPLLDRALLRAQPVFNLDASDIEHRQQKFGQWSDPARAEGRFPALQGSQDRWNGNILKRQVKRDQNQHKLANRRSKGAPRQWILLGACAALRILTMECPDGFWKQLLLTVSNGEKEAVLDHVTAYMHSKCQFSTEFSVFTISSHMATSSLRRKGRSYPSSFCMAKLQDLFTVTAGTGDINVEADNGLVPVYVMYFTRMEWHSGEMVGEGLCAHTRFAYVLLLPTKREVLHSHSIYVFEKNELKMDNTRFHRIVPIQSIVRPLIVDRSVEGSVTLVPFEGKGLVDAPTAGATSAEEEAEVE
jgi:hypothetical protein